MTHHSPKFAMMMPAPARLKMPTQDLSKQFTDPNAPKLAPMKNTRFFRWATLLPALLITLALVVVFSDWFQRDGFTFVELAMIGLVGFSSFWIALSVAASAIGLIAPRKTGLRAEQILPLNVALLIPVYNENPGAIAKRLRAMRDDLAQYPSQHCYEIFVLSDSSDEQIAQREQQMVEALQSVDPNLPKIWYRRRAQNTERKTGNIRDWIENWGGCWDAFVTLDADSLMSAPTIDLLADHLSANNSTALIQTIPQLMGANTLFSRVQQFANNTYGGVLANGLDRWSGNAGNYWGHNAIIRTKAFAACAGLPKLSGKSALGGTIKSHDFVEAALLRRAGWSVQLMPELTDTFEETPQNIVDYISRDNRWCQGNLQHLRILNSAGFSPISRFHMVQGAMAYLASIFWFLLLILWALMGRSEEQNPFRYFTETNPLFPQWPHMDSVSRVVVLCFMLALLLTPKLLGIVSNLYTDNTIVGPIGRLKFLGSALLEIALSFLLAPILMIQHVKAVVRTLAGFDTGWASQNRDHNGHTLSFLIKFHWLETVTGILLTLGISTSVISFWLAPIAICLSAAPFLSTALSWHLPAKGVTAKALATREILAPPPIIQSVIEQNNAALRRDQRASGQTATPPDPHILRCTFIYCERMNPSRGLKGQSTAENGAITDTASKSAIPLAR